MQWKLIIARKNKPNTQEEIAKILGISVEGYRKKEGGVSQFKANEMFILSEYFGVNIENLFLPTKSTIRDLYTEVK